MSKNCQHCPLVSIIMDAAENKYTVDKRGGAVVDPWNVLDEAKDIMESMNETDDFGARRSSDRVLRMADTLNALGFVVVPKDQWLASHGDRIYEINSKKEKSNGSK